MNWAKKWQSKDLKECNDCHDEKHKSEFYIKSTPTGDTPDAEKRSRKPSIHHCWPIIKGGPHTRSNVITTHLGCNSSIGDNMVRPLPILRTSGGAE